MSEQTLNMLKKLSPKKEHSLAFRCFIGAAGHCAADRVRAHPGVHSHREAQRDKEPSGMVPAAGRSVCGCALPAVHSVPGIHHQAGVPYTGTPSGAQGFQVYLSLPWTYRRLQNQHVCGTLCILYGFVCGRHSHIYHYRHTFSLRTV